MITVTRFDGSEMIINAELVKFVEASPDTIITLTSKEKILVKETVPEVINEIVKYLKSLKEETKQEIWKIERL